MLRRQTGGTATARRQLLHIFASTPSSQPWELFEKKMTKAGLSQAAQGAFKMNYEQLVRGVTGLVR